LGIPAESKREENALVRRRVDPAPAGLKNIGDAADHPAVFKTRLATRVRRQMRSDPRESRIREPETIRTYWRFLPKP